MIGQGNRSKHSGTRGGHGVVLPGGLDSALKFERQGLGLLGAEQILAPVEDQGELAQVITRPQRPLRGGSPSTLVAGNPIVQRVGEAGLRHPGLSGHQGLELHPAKGLPLAFPLEQPQPSALQEQARMLRIHLVNNLVGVRPNWRGKKQETGCRQGP
jgi:hypothetical protein